MASQSLGLMISMILAASIVCTVLLGLGVFQLLLAAGAPLGRFAWGGQYRVLPTRLRVGSLVSTFFYAVFAAVVLDRAGILSMFPEQAVRVSVWAIAGLFFLGAIPNLISRSKSERNVMAPLTLLLSILSVVVALG